MSIINATALGIIEGFFGRSWSWDQRKAYSKFLALNKFDFYIYAPKSDAYLRKQWQQDWPADIKKELINLRANYQAAAIDFGIGLSPHEIYLDNSRDNRELLHQRVKQINDLSPDTLCLLFDDMRGDIPDLAKIQIDLMHQVADLSTAKRIIFCPTYYSFDPVLEKVFGKMPENYWPDLNKYLDKKIDIFWTGEKVCSTEYSTHHLAEVTDLLGRKPFLWDNYPVNDGAVKSKLLHLRAVDKSHSKIQNHVAGHALNPMNQSWLSQIALASLPRAYHEQDNYNPEKVFLEITTELCGEQLAQSLLQDLPLLQDQGLGKISDGEKAELLKRYSAFPENSFCAEIIDWLNGGYEFDPACLTE
ncbi:MAG: beta-N-acetylglucosaminidase domain-containing protein [Cellvibrio sp.]